MQNSPEPTNAGATAVDLLVADHDKVEGLFDRFAELSESGATPEAKQGLVKEIVSELQTHERVENEVFFPAVRDVLKKDDVLGVAKEEQIEAGEVIEALADLKTDDPAYDAKVLEMGDHISAHAAEEEEEVFPQVEASSIDTEKLGADMLKKKAAIATKVGVPE